MKHFFSEIICFLKNILIFLLPLKCCKQFLQSLLPGPNCSNNESLLPNYEISEPDKQSYSSEPNCKNEESDPVG